MIFKSIPVRFISVLSLSAGWLTVLVLALCVHLGQSYYYCNSVYDGSRHVEFYRIYDYCVFEEHLDWGRAWSLPGTHFATPILVTSYLDENRDTLLDGCRADHHYSDSSDFAHYFPRRAARIVSITRCSRAQTVDCAKLHLSIFQITVLLDSQPASFLIKF